METLKEKLQREARDRIWENLTDSDSLWHSVDEAISHTISETLAEAVRVIGNEEQKMNHHTCGIDKPNGCCNECSHLAEFNQAISTAITAVEELKKDV